MCLICYLYWFVMSIDSNSGALCYTMCIFILNKSNQKLHREMSRKIKNTKSSSWYVYVAKRLTRYGLDAVNLLEGNTRNSVIKLTIQQYWLSWLKEAALSKSTLRYLDVTKCNFHNPHSTWGATGSNPAETRKAIQKARLLTGTYLLQSNKAAFNQHQVVATCPLSVGKKAVWWYIPCLGGISPQMAIECIPVNGP